MVPEHILQEQMKLVELNEVVYVVLGEHNKETNSEPQQKTNTQMQHTNKENIWYSKNIL